MKRFVLLGFITPLVIILTFFTALAQVNPLGAPENPSAAQDKAYLIGPGDDVEVKVMGESQFDFKATIDDEGMLQVPFFETRLDAKCRMEKDLRNDVAKLMAKYLKTPVVSLRVTDRKSRPPTSVYGEVKNPQGVILVRRTHLLELLTFVGGVTEDAAGSVQLIRTQTPPCPAMVEDGTLAKGPDGSPAPQSYSISEIKSGKMEFNPFVYPGDAVIVQKAPPVYIIGEVRVPQGIHLMESGTSLTQAIAMVGGLTREAKTSSVRVYRLKTGGKTGERETLNADLKLIKEQKQVDIILQSNDIVEVDRAKDSLALSILKIAAGMAKSTATSFSNQAGYRVLY
jgi:protein involved in polysaccharide export with SLBB domain